MAVFEELIKTADWKQEKHAPVIEVPEKVKKGELVTVTVSVGKEIPHPNTLEHHIEWIDVYFVPEGAKAPYHVVRFDFAAHGAAEGVISEPIASFGFKTDKPGTFYVFSFCNIHGIWGNTAKLEVE